MGRSVRFILCCFVVLLTAGIAFAVDACSKCGEKIESPRWNFCPYCGNKLDQAGDRKPMAGAAGAKDSYESVSWNKILLERHKYHNMKVKFTARFTGLQHYFAPAESLGITLANFVNFSFQGNRTNYVDKKKIKVVDRLKHVRPYTSIVIYATIKVKKDVYARGQDVYIVLVDDIDVE